MNREKASKERHGLKYYKRFFPLYALMLPGIVYLIVNNYIPMTGVVVAFKKFNVKDGLYFSPWVGFANFKYLFRSDAWLIIRNTLLYNVAFIAVNMVVGIVLAIFITDVKNDGTRKIYQSAILLPFLISMVVVSYIVFAFFSHENGMLNNIFFKNNPVQWYNEPKYWPAILILVNCWKGVGYGALIYIAAINSIDRSLFEAAALDGASKWQQIRHITLPSIVPTVITLLTMNVGRIFYSDFGLFYQVPRNSGSLFNVTQTIDTYVYRSLMASGGIGRSSAACVFQSVLGFVMVLSFNAIVRKHSRENAIF